MNETNDYDNNVQRPPVLQNMLNKLSEHMTGEPVKPDTCAGCTKQMDLLHLQREFRDELSLQEWKISHLCQKCQDDVFERDDPYENDDPYGENDDSDPDEGDLEDKALRGFGLEY